MSVTPNALVDNLGEVMNYFLDGTESGIIFYGNFGFENQVGRHVCEEYVNEFGDIFRVSERQIFELVFRQSVADVVDNGLMIQ